MNNTAKFKLIMKLILITILLIPFNINANTDYTNDNNRKAQNEKMYDNLSAMTEKQRARYSDKYLKDVAETNYKGMSQLEQQHIQNLSKTILDNKENLTDMQKITEFYNWIKNNFYFYQTPDKIKTLGINCNNPYYLLTKEYNTTGKIRSNAKGYSAMLIALARNENIPARIVEGYYNKEVRSGQNYWVINITENRRNR